MSEINSISTPNNLRVRNVSITPYPCDDYSLQPPYKSKPGKL